MNQGPRILVLSRHRTGKRKASPGIRSYHIARVLAESIPGAQVTLATPSAAELMSTNVPFRAVPYTTQALTRAAWESDIIISSRFPLQLLPVLYHKRAVLDMFTPFITEWIEIVKVAGHRFRQDAYLASLAGDLMVQFLLADLVLCATTRQRDLYFGMLTAIGRITPEAYDPDHWLTNLLAIVPYGVRPGEPKATRRVLRGVWPGIHEDDKILLWNGAVVEWYDVTTLIRAVHRISLQRPDVKLFFLGTEHPDNPGVPKLQGLGGGTIRSALRLCEELGVLDKFVFFNLDWVEYDDTANYLCEADIGVCTYFNNLETRYAFRSRILDLLWAELPIICTRGDAWAERVSSRPLGIAIPERNEDALVEAILRLADDEAFAGRCRANLQEEKETYRWEHVLEGLIDYCRTPAGPLKKRKRLMALPTTLASIMESKLRLALFQRLARVKQYWSRLPETGRSHQP